MMLLLVLLILAGNACGETLALADFTDTPSEYQKRAFLRKIEELPLPRGETLTLCELVGTGAREVFSARNPGRGSDANPFIEGPTYFEQRYQREFALPLAHALEELLSRPGAEVSPIFEALRQLTVFSDFARVGGPRVLVLFTDCFQHADVSYYSSPTTIFDRRGQIRDERWISDLRGVRIDMNVFLHGRDDPARREEALAQWRRYLAVCGAHPDSTSWTCIPE